MKVGPDYHVEYARHWYSVPHELVGQRLSLKAGQSVVQLWHKGQCVAQHPRSTHEYKHTTNPLHMPERHRQHGTWTPERLIEQGKRTGPSTGRVVESMLKAKPPSGTGLSCSSGAAGTSEKNTARNGWKRPVTLPCTITPPDRRFIDNLLRHHRENLELPLSRQGRTTSGICFRA